MTQEANPLTYQTGIREAYESQTAEGWWNVYVTFPSRRFVNWLIANPPYWWATEYDPKYNYDWDLTILIKDIRYLQLFRLRWYSEKEYVITEGHMGTANSYANHLDPYYGWHRRNDGSHYDYVSCPEATFAT